jgi:3-phytase
MENKMIRRITICLILALKPLGASAEPFEVHATAATDLPIQKSDIMDDPAIWVNRKYPEQSLIFGTNKKDPYGGLYVYTLDGKLKESLQIGPINNVDLRTGFFMAHTLTDIAVASFKPSKTLAFFAISPHIGKVTYLGLGDHTFEKKPYGVCLQKHGGDFYAIVTFKYSGAEKWHFWAEDTGIRMKKVASYPIESLAEGCVVDDLTGTVFIGEEDQGIWAFPEGKPAQMIAKVGENGLTADVEGLALYGDKYLIASSQGSSSYNIYRPSPPYNFLGSFKITKGAQEGTEETDGIDVTSANLGGPYTDGLFVAHDNRTSKGGGSNFKLVPWREIKKGL